MRDMVRSNNIEIMLALSRQGVCKLAKGDEVYQ